jgi:DNA-binding transcriptional ArsR family regulator
MSPLSGKNPFRPGVGTKPLFLAGREGPMRRFSAMLRAAPEQPANMRLTGLRGVGKTVLLGEFERLAAEAGWAVVTSELGPRHNRENTLISEMVGLAEGVVLKLLKVERLRRAVGKVVRGATKVGVTYEDVKFTFEPGVTPASANLGKTLLKAVAAAVEKGRNGLMLLLDEAQVVRDERDPKGEHALSALVSAVSALQRQEVPVGLVMCGLPTLTGNFLRARTYTERMFRGEEIGRLDPGEAAKALTEPLRNTELSARKDLVEAVVSEVEGYPYFIQLWGAELWDAATVAEVNALDVALLAAATPDIYRRLDVDFYEPRVSTLTPAEQDVLVASASCDYPPLHTEDLNEKMDKTPGNINVLLGRLVEAGVLYRIRKGQYEYTAPKFREYLMRRVRHAKSH